MIIELVVMVIVKVLLREFIGIRIANVPGELFAH
jgi:hypothetical protein